MHSRDKSRLLRPGISPIDTTLPIKKGGVPFRLGFFQQTVFQAAGVPPLCPFYPPRGCTEKSITQHFFPRVKHAPTRGFICVRDRDEHCHTLHWVASIFSARNNFTTLVYIFWLDCTWRAYAICPSWVKLFFYFIAALWKFKFYILSIELCKLFSDGQKCWIWHIIKFGTK